MPSHKFKVGDIVAINPMIGRCDVLIEGNARSSSAQEAFQAGLPGFERIVPHVLPVQLDQVERPHENARLNIPAPNQFKTGNPVRTARHGLTVNDTGVRGPSLAAVGTIDQSPQPSRDCREYLGTLPVH